jgi:hypothetical protein
MHVPGLAPVMEQVGHLLDMAAAVETKNKKWAAASLRRSPAMITGSPRHAHERWKWKTAASRTRSRFLLQASHVADLLFFAVSALTLLELFLGSVDRLRGENCWCNLVAA